MTAGAPRGIGVSGLNPKGLLVFLAVLPQFAAPHGAWPLAVQLGVLGLVFTLICAGFYLSMGCAARRSRTAGPRCHASSRGARAPR